MPTALPYDSRAWAETDLSAIGANVTALKTWLGPNMRLLAVVKADAYGHGLLPVAQAALSAGADWLGVAAVGEGVALREAGIDAPIALLCVPAPGESEAIITHRLTAAVGDSGMLTALARAAYPRSETGRVPEIHLDIDTGMGRSGVLPEEAAAFWRTATDSGLRVTGLTTHFADADNPGSEINSIQTRRLSEAAQALKAAGATFELFHASNSAATLTHLAPQGNLVRPGLSLYGIHPPFPEGSRVGGEGILPILRPALALKARIATVRTLPAGHTISYGATYTLQRTSQVATVLIGYGDGYPRRLSNRGCMLLNGRRAPILGRVCMDQTVIDVTDIPDVWPGAIATCIGSQENESIRVEEIARLIDTTEHEITTCLTARLPRHFIS